ncbi:hypothetical protein FOJ82_08250 [Tessaracoccus rhinocerotis]|uniref:Uncharacterized protein n=1 Tax=Tessaracoccus rhinocerotis TaxID=1689449 RepID=A0A553K023_9ACTN|nr:hypothetical protein [Tessaracoccus rhinocerotis]TRY18043.1 hypothetical protein FOJ82_08250 [Tessaracoccus rhinocerotis]
MEGTWGRTLFLDGVVMPGVHRGADASAVLQRLRHRNVLGSVGRQSSDAETISQGVHPSRFPLLLCIAATPDLRVLLHTPGGVHPGPHVSVLAADLAEATQCGVEVAGHRESAPPPRFASPSSEQFSRAETAPLPEPEFLAPAVATHDEPRPTAVVVLSRGPIDTMTYLAGVAGAALDLSRSGSWWVARFPEAPPALHKVNWGERDLPVLVLSNHLGARHVSLLADEGVLPGPFTLTRLPDMRVPYSGEELSPEASRITTVLTNMALQPGSQVLGLLQHPSFGHCEARFVAAAVQSAADEGWFSRVLASLGIPTLAGEVFEGAEPPDSFRFNPGGFFNMLQQYQRFDREVEVIPGRPWHNAMARQPWLHAALTASRLLLGLVVAALAVWSGLSWWGIAVVVLMLLNAWDAVATFRTVAFRLERRREPGREVSPG